ncbi:Holliday junction branch migration protein RuvA [Euryhalocaulis caribicus]|uniref:Holliday junction branch migration protein RuvA n=1 Tax=Euryhalocaulis caribicus TaxID=1161401 RepID=UPI0003A1D1D1|nr:Holliday junction branch migration protein RuvA [Euryhalocaulis caribicus]
MIGKLKGVVDTIGEGEAILDVHGVGYLVFAGARTLRNLQIGEAAELHIETEVREDAFKLWAFASEGERAWFARLKEVPGVGSKVAAAILDALTPDDLMNASALEDAGAVSRAHGVGKKLAARVVSELKDKAPPSGRGLAAAPAPSGPGAAPNSPAAAASGVRLDAVSALTNLGYDRTDAQRAVAEALADAGDDPELDAVLKAALKELAR